MERLKLMKMKAKIHKTSRAKIQELIEASYVYWTVHHSDS